MSRYEFKKKYSKITYIKRLKLIDLAIDQGLGVTKAARQLRIKVPTAKVILSNYRKKHIIYRKKSDNVIAKPKVEVQTPIVKVQHQEQEEPEQMIPDNFTSNTQPSIPNMIILPCYYLTPYAVWPTLPPF